jgi:2-methylisocitrate lyase-like PEP mutase family enzyme
LTNVYDGASARAVAGLPRTHTIATASHAIASAAGVPDDDLTLAVNLAAVRAIIPVSKQFGLAISVGWQDGYHDKLDDGVRRLLELGIVGINLGDYDKEAQKMIPVKNATERTSEESLGYRKEAWSR